MKEQIRYGVFESNSSSTHSLTLCTQEEFDAWKKGEVLFTDYWKAENKFVKALTLSDGQKMDAKEDYEIKMEKFWKTWDDLSENEKNEWYETFARENELYDEDCYTYNQYMYNGDLETFVETYTSPNGDKIVAFGKFGYC